MHGHGLDELAQLHLGHTPITYDEVTGTGRNRLPFAQVPIDRATAYAAEDADVALRLWQALRPRLRFGKSLALYEQMERRLTGVLMDMERAGIKVDADDLRRMSVDFEQRMAVMERECHRLAGFEFNVGSPKQLGEVLFDKMGLPGGKRMKTGAWGTDSSVLQALADQGLELPASVLDWRQLQKLKSTYADSLVQQINPDTGRVHTSFAQAIASTGRLSSNDPNLQNIPIRTEEGSRIRHAFIAEPGHVLVSCDYSQIELRLLAHVAELPALRDSFARGEDIHARTASRSVRGADGRHGPDDAAAREGDQFRHHLRHQRLRPGTAIGHRSGRGAGVHRPLFRTLSGHPCVYGTDERGSADQRLRDDAVRAALLGAGDRRQEPGAARLCRAAVDQRSVARRRGGYHQAGDDPPAGGVACGRTAVAHAAASA